MCRLDPLHLTLSQSHFFSYNRPVPDSISGDISASTRVCAVFGRPIKHSASPAMHNAAFSETGLNWRYLAFDVDPARLRSAIEGAGSMHFAGLNLTVPHKLLAMEMVDELDESARAWGAVNTIRFEGETAEGWKPLREFSGDFPGRIRSHGFNTDADAVTRSIREDLGLSMPGASVLLLGAGGAGRVAALKFASDGCSTLWLVNRTRSKAEELASEIRNRFPAVEVQVGYPKNRIDLVVNATSAGLKESDPLPFDPAMFSPGNAGAAYDMIYRPSKTAFLARAEQEKCRIANGLGMLLYQGAAAFEIWTGVPAPLETMRKSLMHSIYA